MQNARMIRAVIKEYGASWVINRSLYSLKIKALSSAPFIERLFEKKAPYPKRLDLFKINVSAIKRLLLGMDHADKEQLIETADQACEGTITGFSSVELDYGSPVDWQLNPLTGKRTDESKKWFRIPDFDNERGDIKVIWEASRFSHFITFARAYLLTEDRKYYLAFSKQLKDWLNSNPYGLGANFKCGQECSFRMANALLAYSVFSAYGVATDADAGNVRELVNRCYHKILSNFFYAYKCIRNNHTISELMGMIIGAWCCDDQRRLRKLFALLDKVIDEQFTDDGGYRQYSFNYQRLALQDLECVLSIGQAIGRTLSEKSIEKIRQSARLMYQCQDQNGDVPNYGNNDGSLVFPVSSCGYRDFRPTINAVHALTNGTQLYGAGKYQEELLWFSGGKRLAEFAFEKKNRVSSRFEKAGLFTLRGDNSWCMVISSDYHSRPAHMDQNHFDLWVDGMNILCDAGTYSYASDLGKRLLRNESHNTAAVDGRPQMSMSGSFMIYGWTRRKLGAYDENSFEGETVSSNGYSHTRTVKRSPDSYEISDLVDQDYSIAFHTPCSVLLQDGRAVLKHGEKTVCEILSTGAIQLTREKRSLFYLKEEAVTCLIIHGSKGAWTKTEIHLEKETEQK